MSTDQRSPCADPSSDLNPQFVQAVLAGDWRKALGMDHLGIGREDKVWAAETWVRKGHWDCISGVCIKWSWSFSFGGLFQLILKSTNGIRQLHGETGVKGLNWYGISEGIFGALLYHLNCDKILYPDGRENVDVPIQVKEDLEQMLYWFLEVEPQEPWSGFVILMAVMSGSERNIQRACNAACRLGSFRWAFCHVLIEFEITRKRWESCSILLQHWDVIDGELFFFYRYN